MMVISGCVMVIAMMALFSAIQIPRTRKPSDDLARRSAIYLSGVVFVTGFCVLGYAASRNLWRWRK